MSILYKPKEEQTLSVEIKVEDKINILFTKDCGKHGTEEIIDEYNLTPERLLKILQDGEDYKEDEY